MPMKTTVGIVAIIMCAVALPVISQAPSKMAESKNAALAAWDRFITQQFKVSQSEGEIEKLMAGRFRDRGKIHYGGTGAYSVVYLIDDFHQIIFSFDVHSKLTALPIVGGTKPWLRFPDGTVVEVEN